VSFPKPPHLIATQLALSTVYEAVITTSSQLAMRDISALLMGSCLLGMAWHAVHFLTNRHPTFPQRTSSSRLQWAHPQCVKMGRAMVGSLVARGQLSTTASLSRASICTKE
jgi:hypothetical protein